MDIRDLVSRRSDLSTFVVHLTRNDKKESAKGKLKSMLRGRLIKARSMFGQAKSMLEKKRLNCDSQRCVCFTETPVEYIYLLLEEIEKRGVHFEPYGIAITKRVARQKGVNPVWYLDITPGHEWLTNPVNKLINKALTKGSFDNSPIAKLAPFIEQMGTKNNKKGVLDYQKEFWWEREWRHQGDFKLPDHFIVLCPEEDIPAFKKWLKKKDLSVPLLDPRWGLEQIIARLAGFKRDEINVL